MERPRSASVSYEKPKGLMKYYTVLGGASHAPQGLSCLRAIGYDIIWRAGVVTLSSKLRGPEFHQEVACSENRSTSSGLLSNGNHSATSTARLKKSDASEFRRRKVLLISSRWSPFKQVSYSRSSDDTASRLSSVLHYN